MDKVHRITAFGLARQRQRDTWDGRGLLPRPTAQRESFFPIRSAGPSYDSRANLPVAIARRSWGSRSVAWAQRSLASSPGVPGRLIADSGSAACSDPARRIDTPVAGSVQSVPPSMWRQSVSPWALPVFFGDRLQRLDVQRVLRPHLL